MNAPALTAARFSVYQTIPVLPRRLRLPSALGDWFKPMAAAVSCRRRLVAGLPLTPWFATLLLPAQLWIVICCQNFSFVLLVPLQHQHHHAQLPLAVSLCVHLFPCSAST